MITSEQTNEVVAALAKCQAKFPSITKLKEGKGGSYTYKYADLADTVKQTLPVLAENGLCVIQDFGMVDRNITCTTRIAHTSGQFIEGTLPFPLLAPEHMNAMQGLGNQITYLRRYTYCAMIGVVADDDLDGGGLSNTGSELVEKQKPAPKEMNDSRAVDQPVTMNGFAQIVQYVNTHQNIPNTEKPTIMAKASAMKNSPAELEEYARKLVEDYGE